LVTWPRVARTVELGGLGVIDLTTMGYALRLCWEWLARTDHSRLWTTLPNKNEKIVKGMFDALDIVDVGNGLHTLFQCFGRTNGSTAIPFNA
jgi:hypothetical protein